MGGRSAGINHGGGEDALTKENVEAMSSLNPREKEGGNMENM